MKTFGLLLLVAGWSVPGLGQVSPDVDALVQQMVRYSANYRQTLPSLECDERIVSQKVTKGKVKDEVVIDGTFRVTRTGPEVEPFVESHRYLTVNGKEAPKHFGMPFFLQGAFANGVGFNPVSLGCYSYTKEAGTVVGQVVIVSKSKADLSSEACANVAPGAGRRTVVDEATGHVLHVEVTTPAEMAKKMKRPYFAEIDYAAVKLGDATAWLPVRASTHDDKDEGRFEVRYANFHRFGGGMTILPGTEKVSGETQ